MLSHQYTRQLSTSPPPVPATSYSSTYPPNEEVAPIFCSPDSPNDNIFTALTPEMLSYAYQVPLFSDEPFVPSFEFESDTLARRNPFDVDHGGDQGNSREKRYIGSMEVGPSLMNIELVGTDEEDSTDDDSVEMELAVDSEEGESEQDGLCSATPMKTPQNRVDELLREWTTIMN